MIKPLIEVKNLSKQFYLKGKIASVVQNISFSLIPGEILGIGGESGCGNPQSPN